MPDKSREAAAPVGDARASAILETALDCIIIMDSDGVVTEFNPAAERTFGYRRADVIGRRLVELIIPPSLRERHRQGMARYLATGEATVLGRRIEVPALRRDGSEFPVELAITRIPGDGPPLFAAYLRDIGTRVRAEQLRNVRFTVTQQLAQAPDVAYAAQAVLRAVGEHLRWDFGAFWCVDHAAQKLSCIETWSARPLSLGAFERVSRGHTFRRGEGLPGRVWESGQSAWILDVANEPAFPRAPHAAAANLRSAFACPIVVGEHDLGVMEFFTQHLREPDAELLETMGTVAGHVGQFIERRQAEERLREDIAARRRVEVALRDADRRKDEFLATLAHELRNPLAPIVNSLQILKMPAVDAALAQRTREMMERQVRHLVRLVDDLMDMSRVVRGKIELRREPVELAAIVARAVETAQPLIDARGHRLELALGQASLMVDGDPVRLAQVVGNLLANAARYTEPDGRILVSAGASAEQAVLSVEDNGIGIAPEVLPRVFDPFVQGDQATTRAHGGLGIGLTLVKTLVELHAGTVEIHSAGRGKGTRVTIRLPLSDTPHAAARAPGMAAAPAPAQRILVVDDNRDAADSLAALLRLQAHDVRVAYDGASAIAAARAQLPGCVFLDIGMPGMDGYECAQRLRAIPGMQGARLIALTGWGQEQDRRRSAAAGFDHHLVKPPDAQALRQVLAKVVPGGS